MTLLALKNKTFTLVGAVLLIWASSCFAQPMGTFLLSASFLPKEAIEIAASIDGNDWNCFLTLQENEDMPEGITESSSIWNSHQIGSTDAAPLAAQDGYVYFRNAADHDDLYRVKADGSNPTKVCDSCASMTSGPSAVPGDGYVYYLGEKKELYRTEIATGQSECLNYVASSSPCVPGDGYLYFKGTDRHLYKMTTEGDGLLLLSNIYMGVGTPSVPGDGYVYYLGADNRLYRTELATGKSQYLNHVSPSSPCVSGDHHIYFQGTDGGLYKTKTDGTDLHRLGDIYVTSAPVVPGDGFVYYLGLKHKLYRINTAGTDGAFYLGTKAASLPSVQDGIIYSQGLNNELWSTCNDPE